MMSWKWFGWGMTGAAALTVAGLGTVCRPVGVSGSSMAPALRSGQWILVDRAAYLSRPPASGDVVVLEREGQLYVKRVYRGPGETLHYVADGDGWIQPVREAHAQALNRRYRRYRSKFRVRSMQVPADAVFVIGDNFGVSEDSRDWGPVPVGSLLGRAHLQPDRTPLLACEVRLVTGRPPAGAGPVLARGSPARHGARESTRRTAHAFRHHGAGGGPSPL